MTSLEVLDIGKEAVWVFLKITTPIICAALAVGLLISLFQALTQIQENTLSFVPKIILVFFVILMTMPFISNELTVFTEHITEKIIEIE